MAPGDLGGGVDVAQLCVVAFFLFFIGLVLTLRREDKREGYPLKDPAGRPDQLGFPEPPKPKVFHLMEGGLTTAPHPEEEEALPARPLALKPGFPLAPTADPLLGALGPAAFAQRKDEPLIMSEDKIQVLPLRLLPEWSLVWEDLDPRGMIVVGAEGTPYGTVADVWIDRSVKILRYLEIALDGVEAPARRVIAPIYFADINPRRKRVKLIGVPGRRLLEAPGLATGDRITAREEDRVNAFYAGAKFYAAEDRKRAAPVRPDLEGARG